MSDGIERINGQDCVAVRPHGTYTPITGPVLTYVSVQDVATALVEQVRDSDEWVSGHDLIVRVGALVMEAVDRA